MEDTLNKIEAIKNTNINNNYSVNINENILNNYLNTINVGYNGINDNYNLEILNTDIKYNVNEKNNKNEKNAKKK